MVFATFMYVFKYSYLVKSGKLRCHNLGNSCSLGFRDVLFVLVPDCKYRFSHLRFRAWDFRSHCAIF